MHSIRNREPKDAGIAEKKSRRRFRVACLFAVLGVLLVGSWWFEVPRLWLCDFADRSLRQYDAHGALNWVKRAQTYYPKDVGIKLLAARANLQLNMNGKAFELLESAQTVGASIESLEPYRLMAEAQRGNHWFVAQIFRGAHGFDQIS